jgi:hypothetical protein
LGVLPVYEVEPVEVGLVESSHTVLLLYFFQATVQAVVEVAALSTVASRNARFPSVNVVVAVPDVGPVAVTL